MRTTQRKGDIAVATGIATFTRMGFDVSLPITESAAYDFIVDDGELHRVQAKYSKDIQVDLRGTHHNGGGFVNKHYKENSYDWLYVYRPNGEEYLVKECLTGTAKNMRPEWLMERQSDG